LTNRLFKIWLVFFLLLAQASFSQTLDTVLVRDLKNFFYKETGYVLKGDFFTKWDYSDDYWFFVSPSDKIGSLDEEKIYTRTINNDTLNENPVYDTFRYDVPADAACKLRPEFPTYSSDGLAFVIFHELMHNFIRQNHISIPYAFEEAVCDVMGNYCTLEFAKSDSRVTISSAKRQIVTNDRLYAVINRCIDITADHPERMAAEHARCDKSLQKILADANEFQKFRFNYKVNNGFLLKCRNYSWNYFLFQKIYREQHSMSDFIKTLYHLSDYYHKQTAKEKEYSLQLYAHTNWTLEVKFVWDSLSPILPDHNNFYVTVTNRDPLNIFLQNLRNNCEENQITADTCLKYWNKMVKKPWNWSNIKDKDFLLTGDDSFGKNWVVTSAFVSDKQVLCWMEEANLQMGKKTKVVLSKDNAVLINIGKGGK
jgi:hypothetical protein